MLVDITSSLSKMIDVPSIPFNIKGKEEKPVLLMSNMFIDLYFNHNSQVTIPISSRIADRLASLKREKLLEVIFSSMPQLLITSNVLPMLSSRFSWIK